MKTINDRIEEDLKSRGHIIIARCGGQPSLSKSSNARRTIERWMRDHNLELPLDAFAITPGARRRYRSEGYINTISLLPGVLK